MLLLRGGYRGDAHLYLISPLKGHTQVLEIGILGVLWVDSPEELPLQSCASFVYLGAF